MMTSNAEQKPPVSLILVNYRSASYLARALESLQSIEKADIPAQIIVVNNDAGESGVLRGLQEKFRFVLIENSKNGGFGQGANLGALSAQSEIIGFLNPDILWQKKCLKEIKAVFEDDENVGIVGMRLIDMDRRPDPWSYGKEPTFLRIIGNNLFPFWKIRSNWEGGLIRADWVSGGALFIRKSVFQSVGGFDEQYFLYFEDVDLCRRVRDKKHRIVHVPTLPLLHYGGKSQSVTGAQKKHFYASQEIYFKKYRTSLEYFLLRLFRFLRHAQ